jgi:hypothetical protein
MLTATKKQQQQQQHIKRTNKLLADGVLAGRGGLANKVVGGLADADHTVVLERPGRKSLRKLKGVRRRRTREGEEK